MDEASPPRPAGFWIRAVALAIDLVVFALVERSFEAMATAMVGPSADGESPSGAATLFTLLFTAVYATVLHAVTGQTIGKMLVGVQVLGVDGAPLPVGAAFLRYLAGFISLIPLGFGFLVAALRRDKRGLHDLIAGSRVQRLPARRRLVRRAVPSRPPVGTLQDPAMRSAAAPATDA
jgi:uncharacterized RDD family membrane protein YckC